MGKPAGVAGEAMPCGRLGWSAGGHGVRLGVPFCENVRKVGGPSNEAQLVTKKAPLPLRRDDMAGVPILPAC